MLAWLRASIPLWLLAPLAFACTRDNPAYETGDDDLGEVGSETSEQTSEADEAETEALVCEYDPGTPLAIRLPEFCQDTLDEDGFNVSEHWFLIAEAEGDSWRLAEECEPGCDPSGCQMLTLPVHVQVSPFDLGALAGADQCIHVIAKRPEFDTTTTCEFEAIAVWRYGESRPLLVASKSELVVSDGLAATGGLTPTLEPDNDCECEGLANATCCPPSAAPGQWHFDVGGEEIAVGESPLIAGDYRFHALQAHNATGCSGDTQQAWALIRED